MYIILSLFVWGARFFISMINAKGFESICKYVCDSSLTTENAAVKLEPKSQKMVQVTQFFYFHQIIVFWIVDEVSSKMWQHSSVGIHSVQLNKAFDLSAYY